MRETNGYSLRLLICSVKTPCFVGSSWCCSSCCQEDAAVEAAKAAAWMRQHELLGVTTMGGWFEQDTGCHGATNGQEWLEMNCSITLTIPFQKFQALKWSEKIPAHVGHILQFLFEDYIRNIFFFGGGVGMTCSTNLRALTWRIRLTRWFANRERPRCLYEVDTAFLARCSIWLAGNFTQDSLAMHSCWKHRACDFGTASSCSILTNMFAVVNLAK